MSDVMAGLMKGFFQAVGQEIGRQLMDLIS